MRSRFTEMPFTLDVPPERCPPIRHLMIPLDAVQNPVRGLLAGECRADEFMQAFGRHCIDMWQMTKEEEAQKRRVADAMNALRDLEAQSQREAEEGNE